MAAGLQSFQSNDKQMQAIRELTNEVFNLKNREVVSEDKITTLEARGSYKILFHQSIALTAPGMSIESGSTGTASLYLDTVTALNIDGYKPKAIIIERLLSGDSTIADVLVSRSYIINTGTPERSIFYLSCYNTRATSITITNINATIIYEEA